MKKARSALKPVTDGKTVLALREAAERVYVSRELARYIVTIVNATRTHPDVVLGSSPRGTIALVNACRAYALYLGRGYVLPEDVKYLAPHVLAHRLLLNHEAKIARRSDKDVIASILDSVAVPIGRDK